MERWRVTRGGVRSVSGSSSSSSTIIMLRDKDTDHAATATANVDQQPRYYYDYNTIKQQQLHVDVDRYSSTTSISVTADQEISIFDAHKYFNQLSINNHIDGQNHKVQVSDGLSGVSRFSWAAGSPSVSSVDDAAINYPLRLRARSFHVVSASATPTASSEASWNSQTGLLSNPRCTTTATNSNVAFMVPLRSRTSTNHPPRPHHDDHQITNKKKLRGWSKTMSLSPRWLTAFPRRSARCPCSGKKSVQVVAQEKKSSMSSPSSIVRVGGGDIYNMQAQLILTKDEIPPAAPTTSVITDANLNNSSIARPRDDNRHVLWGDERRRNWERQVSNTTINVQPAANSITTTTSCISTAASGGGFSFPILKFNGDGGTSLPSATTSIRNPSNNTTDHVQCGRLIGDVNNKDEDVGSDASSDLFEIESFSTSTTQTLQATNADMPTYPPPSSSMFENYYRTRRDSFSLVEDAVSFTAARRLSANNNSRRTSLDRRQHDPPMASLSTDQYCYEPSEASIDWSVTTAEGFDRSDQYDHDHHDHHDDADLGTKVMTSSKRRPPSLGSNNNNMGLLSCRREKAVSVGPNPVRLMDMPAAPADHDYCQSRHRGVGVEPTSLSVCSNNSRATMHVGSRSAALARQ
ncbi:hypothetical protein ACFX2B_009115 [Malus domestica]